MSETNNQSPVKNSVRIFTDMQALAFLAAFVVHWSALKKTKLTVTHGTLGFGAREEGETATPADGFWFAFRSTGAPNMMEPVFSKELWLYILTNPSELKDFVMKEIFVSETEKG